MSAIREVYSGTGEPKAEYSVPAPTILEQVDAVMDAMFGPTEHSYVSIMYAVSDRLSEQGFALATTQPLLSYALCKASCEIGMAAQKLDAELVDKLVVSLAEEGL